jgi:hypothetical protein
MLGRAQKLIRKSFCILFISFCESVPNQITWVSIKLPGRTEDSPIGTPLFWGIFGYVADGIYGPVCSRPGSTAGTAARPPPGSSTGCTGCSSRRCTRPPPRLRPYLRSIAGA